MNIASKIIAVGALALVGTMAFAPAASAAATYAIVDGHAAYGAKYNQPENWGEGCFKIDGNGTAGGGKTYVLPAGTYSKVAVNAGSVNSTKTPWTIYDAPVAGETVWADTNGTKAFEPEGKPSDKNISHIIVCEGSTTVVEPPKETLPTVIFPTAPTAVDNCNEVPKWAPMPAGPTFPPVDHAKWTTDPATGAATLTADEGYVFDDLVNEDGFVTSITYQLPKDDGKVCPVTPGGGNTGDDTKKDDVIKDDTTKGDDTKKDDTTVVNDDTTKGDDKDVTTTVVNDDTKVATEGTPKAKTAAEGTPKAEANKVTVPTVIDAGMSGTPESNAVETVLGAGFILLLLTGAALTARPVR